MSKVCIIVLFLLCGEMYSQQKDSLLDCSKFHVGKFIYTQVQGGYSLRSKKKQISYYKEGWTATFKIKWLEECKFTLTFVKTSSPNMKTFSKGDVLFVTIDSVEGDCYTFTVEAQGKKLPPTQMCKVKE